MADGFTADDTANASRVPSLRYLGRTKQTRLVETVDAGKTVFNLKAVVNHAGLYDTARVRCCVVDNTSGLTATIPLEVVQVVVRGK